MKTFLLQSLIVAFIICFSIHPYTSYAQKKEGYVNGTIRTADGKPAAAVSVVLEQCKCGTISDEEGAYAMAKLPPGTYSLKVSAIGIAPQVRRVVIENGKKIKADFIIDLSARQLEDVIVETRQNRFYIDGSNGVSKMPLKNLENPQIYNVITGDLMREQVVTNINQALMNIPGAMVTTVNGGNGGTYVKMRGFYTTGGFRDGLASIQNAGSDPVNIEKIEAIKGPSGALFGATASYGGLVNRVTKVPYDMSGGEINYFFGANNLNRLTIDYNTPLNKDKTILFRLNGALNKENNFQDYGYKKNITIDPSFLFLISGKLKIFLNTEIYNSSWIGAYYNYSFSSNLTNIKDMPVGYKQSLIGNSLENSIRTFNNYLRGEYLLSRHWKSVTAFSSMENIWQPAYFYGLSWLKDSTYSRSISKTEHTTFATFDIQQNFLGDFKMGNLRNRVVLGVDYYHYKGEFGNYGSLGYDTIILPNQNVSALSKPKFEDELSGKELVTSFSSQSTLAVYASDAVNLTDQLVVMGSVRLDHFHNDATYSMGAKDASKAFTQNAWSPKFGLVYQLVRNKVSVFSSYSNGFVNNGPVTQADGSVSIFKPEHAGQFEGGIKANVFQSRLSGSISYFNILINDKIRLDDASGLQVQNGSQRNSGMELDVKANPVDRLNIVAGYSYLKANYLKVASNLEGKVPSTSPKSIANVWMDYRLKCGMGLAIGGNYTGESFGNTQNTFILPSYMIIGVTLFYEYKGFRFALKGNNVGNVKYWDINYSPQPLRQLVGSVSCRF